MAPLGTEIVTFEGREYGFTWNGLGVINAVPFFDVPTFMDPATNWSIPTKALEVRAAILHHWAGWYGDALTSKATPSEEFAQLVACARDHRARFGIGPAYNLIVFPSGRVWAVGRHGTHRAHTKGRDPETLKPWNHVGRSVCAAGDLSKEPVGSALAQGLITGVQEVLSWPGVIKDAPVHEHGITPTVNSAGVKFSQATECPGRNLSAWRASGGLVLPEAGGPSYEPEPLEVVWRAGYRVGRGHQAQEDHDHLMSLAPALLQAVASPKDAPAAPPASVLREIQRRAS